MENEILKEILSNIKNITTKLVSIEEQQSYLSKQFDTSHNEQIAFHNEFNTFRDEQIAFRNEFNTFRDEQIAFRNEFNTFRDEQIAFRNEFNTFRDEQIAFRNEFNIFRDEQIAFHNEFNTFRDEQIAFRNEVTKQLADLRTDVDTIYVLEVDSRKTLKENTDILHEHSNILNELIKLAKVNQEQHEDFDKRISFLESIVS